jgi:iron complex outermembrane recepter protein
MQNFKGAAAGVGLSLICTLALLTAAYARADSPAPLPFDIGPQSLATALSAFARQSHKEMLFSPEIVAHKFSSGVHGTMPPLIALRVLLKDSDLAISTTPRGAILVRASGAEKPFSTPTPPPTSENSSSLEGSGGVQGRIILAQSTNTPSLATTNNAAQNSLTEIGEIVVTAQRRQEKNKDVPISVLALSGSALQERGITNTAGLQEAVPSLTFTSSGLAEQPAIRGIGSTISGVGADANVAIYVDGVYQADTYGLNLTLPDIDRIEVLSGPQGTLFGRNTTGGAIRIATRDPSFTATGDLSAQEGFYSNTGRPDTTLFGFFSGPIVSDQVAGSIALYYRQTPGWMFDAVHGGTIGIIGDTEVRGKLLFQPTDNMKWILTGYYADNNDPVSLAVVAHNGNTVGRSSLIAPYSPYVYQGNLVPSVRQEIYSGNLRGVITFDAGTLTTITSYARDHTPPSFLQDADGSPAPITGYVQQFQQLTESEEIDFASRNYGPISFTAGLIAYHDDNAESLHYLNQPVYLYADDITNSYGVFGQAMYKILPDLTLTAGVRYGADDINYSGSQNYATLPHQEFGAHTWRNTSARGSIDYAITDSINTYFTFSQGYHSGVYNLFSGNGTFAAPERLNAYEIGLKTATTDYSLNTAIYYYDFDDIQASVFNGLSNIVTNAARATLYGLDVTGAARITSNFKLSGGVGWEPHASYNSYVNGVDYVPLPTGGNKQVTGDFSGDRLVFAPKLTVNLSAQYLQEFRWGVMSTSVTGSHNSGFSFDPLNNVGQPAYYMLNADIGWSPVGSGLKVSIFGKNLTNAVVLAGKGLFSPIGTLLEVQAPREIGLAVNYHY